MWSYYRKNELLSTKHKSSRNWKDKRKLSVIFFDENILNEIADHTKNRTKDTITRLQRVESYSKSISSNKSKDKYTWVKVLDKTRLDPLFG